MSTRFPIGKSNVYYTTYQGQWQRETDNWDKVKAIFWKSMVMLYIWTQEQFGSISGDWSERKKTKLEKRTIIGPN